ncbi:oxygenase MpaB family protein [Nocardioides zeae]|uniref:Oxygenase MpaB family protein n=1 Tax=Nocardioides imazamoxiresistens TaxID=3231893 RepID=A0ABU3PW00_9ACTN|nr:oxygenase MpaB family protein [Nocardioides zeae]MDT9592920.1 oxygenase MpaB family protein [Nocardioides zeae]
MPRRRRTAGLDPVTQHADIYRTLALYEFPWDLNQALSFALFRTFAVPSIGGLLDRTHEFTARTQQRYDDTSLLLEVPLVEGADSPRGRAAIRRINQMHRMYDIGNDDMRYVLATFVVCPTRWVAAYGWRDLTDDERTATVHYYAEVGRLMGIRDLPTSYAAYEQLMDSYEREHFAYDAGSRRVADATLDLLTTFYPRGTRRAVRASSLALMDDALLDALGYPRPSARARRLATGALRARGRLVRLLPPRRRPAYVRDQRRIRSYPDGFVVEEMGTHVPGCPVPHARRGA